MTTQSEIITIDNITFDGKSYLYCRQPEESDIKISNTEGTLHLKTLCKIFGIDIVNDMPPDVTNDQINSYIKCLWDTWILIKSPLMVTRDEKIPFIDYNKYSIPPISILPNDIIPSSSQTLNLPTTTSHAPSFVATNDINPVIDVEGLVIDEIEYEKPKLPNYVKSFKVPFSLPVPLELNQNLKTKVYSYYQEHGHQYLEGKSIKAISNIIARSKSTYYQEVQSEAKQIYKIILELNNEGLIQLTLNKQYIAPYIPDNIRELSIDGECDITYIELLKKYKNLGNIGTFDKLINIITNSVINKLCVERKSHAPAYYIAEQYLKIHVYTQPYTCIHIPI